jgi:hypothetical protein
MCYLNRFFCLPVRGENLELRCYRQNRRKDIEGEHEPIHLGVGGKIWRLLCQRVNMHLDFLSDVSFAFSAVTGSKYIQHPRKTQLWRSSAAGRAGLAASHRSELVKKCPKPCGADFQVRVAWRAWKPAPHARRFLHNLSVVTVTHGLSGWRAYSTRKLVWNPRSRRGLWGTTGRPRSKGRSCYVGKPSPRPRRCSCRHP